MHSKGSCISNFSKHSSFFEGCCLGKKFRREQKIPYKIFYRKNTLAYRQTITYPIIYPFLHRMKDRYKNLALQLVFNWGEISVWQLIKNSLLASAAESGIKDRVGFPLCLHKKDL